MPSGKVPGYFCPLAMGIGPAPKATGATAAARRLLFGVIVQQTVLSSFSVQVGTRNNCTFCGVFRRQALDRGATLMKADKVGAVACVRAAEFSTMNLLVWCPTLRKQGLTRS